MHNKFYGKEKESYVFVVSDAGIAGNAWMSNIYVLQHFHYS